MFQIDTKIKVRIHTKPMRTHTHRHSFSVNTHTAAYVAYNGIQNECEAQPFLEGLRPEISSVVSPDECRGKCSFASSHCHLHKASQSASSSLSPLSIHFHILPAWQQLLAQGHNWKQTTPSALSLDLISQSHKSQHAIWKPLPSTEGLFTKEPIFYSEITFPSERSWLL